MLPILLTAAAILAAGATLLAIVFKKALLWRFMRTGVVAFALLAIVAVITTLLATSLVAYAVFLVVALFITTFSFALVNDRPDGDLALNGAVVFGLVLAGLALCLYGGLVLRPHSQSEKRQLEAAAQVQVMSQNSPTPSPEEVWTQVDRWEALSIAKASLAERVPEGWITPERSAYQRVNGKACYVFEILSERAETKEGIRGVSAIGYVVVNADNPKAAADLHLFYGSKWRMTSAFELQKQVFASAPPAWPVEFTNGFTLELDETGHPYYVASLDRPVIRFGGVSAPVGVVTIDARTGKISRYYSAAGIPAWIEHVYSAQTVRDLLGIWGSRNGGLDLGVPSKAAAVQVVATREGPAWRSLLVSGEDGRFVRHIAVTNARTGATRLYTPPRDFSIDALTIIEQQTEGVVARVLPPENGLTTFFLAGQALPYRGGVGGREGVFPVVTAGQQVRITYYTGHGLRRVVDLQVVPSTS